MASEVTFNAVKSSMSMLAGFFAEVSKEVGEEKAVELYARKGTEFGDLLGNIIKSRMNQPDAAGLIQQELKTLYERFGFTTEFEKKDGKLIANSYRCPMYDGFIEAGLKPQTIHKMCIAFTDREKARLQEIVPSSNYAMTEFRTSSDGCCREEITLGL